MMKAPIGKMPTMSTKALLRTVVEELEVEDGEIEYGENEVTDV